MNVKSVSLNIKDNNRLLFISDTHGNVDGLREILNNITFTKDDYLFIIGDIIEKGNHSIEILDYIMYLIDEGYKVYPIMGNCDYLLEFMKPPVNTEALIGYVLTKKTILNEFAERLNIRINKNSNLNTLCYYIYKNFKKYYDFVLNLPHIIYINDKITLVHGGIDDEDNIPLDANFVMKNDNFYAKSTPKKRIMIVGHYPTINYHDDFPNVNPIIDLNKNIISIDGGNVVVPWGQLNLLIIDNINDMNISYITHDNFKNVRINEDVCGNNLKLFNMPPFDNEVEILSELDDYFMCKHKKSGTVLPILKMFVYYSEKRGSHFSYDAFNYEPNLTKGEVVKLVYVASPYSIIKKNGVMGLVQTKYLDLYGDM